MSDHPSQHPAQEELAALGVGLLPPEADGRVRAHVGGCSECSLKVFEQISQARAGAATSVVAGPAPLPPDPEDPIASLPRGASIGRYVMLERLGSGGMGVVYAAFDPELERKVAIKILQSHRSGAAGQAWLLREAQAMARLSHPNVIAVHDVGVWNERVFVAMELVEGETLRGWLREKPRQWRETVSTLLAAGAGLAAAHSAGIVHRDFKPENVLVAKDGRVRVLDFGLARASGEQVLAEQGPPHGTDAHRTAEAAPPSSGPPVTEGHITPSSLIAEAVTPVSQAAAITHADSRGLVSTPLTQAGLIMGTVPYMAPEQLRGKPADPRTDQFSFAVTAYEALYGDRPFISEDLASPDRWRFRDAPASTQVPAVLRKVLLRALSSEPDARYPSMDALLGELGVDPGARRRRGLFAAAAGVALLASVGVTYGIASRRTELCSGAGASLATAWNAERAGKIEAAFAKTGKPFAADSASAVRKTFDAHGASWSQMRTEACEATRVRGEQTDEVLALRMACLDQRLEELRSLASVFESADGPVVTRAAEAASGLSPVKGCADVVALLAPVRPPDDSVRVAVEDLRRKLAEPSALLRTGAFTRALEVSRSLSAEARKVPYAPLRAEALLLQGQAELDNGDYKSAERTLLEAATAAQEGRSDAVGTQAWDRLTLVVGVTQARFESAHDYHLLAAATLARLGPQDALKAQLLATRARIYVQEGKYVPARADAEEAVRLHELASGPESPATAGALNALALVQWRSGSPEEGEKSYRRALAIREKVLGAEHPDTAATIHGLAAVMHSTGRFDDARGFYERALAIREKALGPMDPEVGKTVNNLSALHAMQSQFAEARPHAERALAIMEVVHGPQNPFTAFALTNLGNIVRELGDAEGALKMQQRALAIREKALGPAHTDVAQTLNNIADLLRTSGKLKEALELNLRSVAIREKALSPTHRDLAISLYGLAQSQLKLRKYPDAIASAERILKIHEAGKPAPNDLGDAKLMLARALHESGKDKARATTLALAAKESFANGKDPKRVKECDDWLAERTVVRR